MLESWVNKALTDGALARLLKVVEASPLPPTTGGVTDKPPGLACTAGGVAFVAGAGVIPGLEAPVGEEPGTEVFWLELVAGRLPVLKNV